jgi:hypothetical protein
MREFVVGMSREKTGTARAHTTPRVVQADGRSRLEDGCHLDVTVGRPGPVRQEGNFRDADVEERALRLLIDDDRWLRRQGKDLCGLQQIRVLDVEQLESTERERMLAMHCPVRAALQRR